MNENVSSHQHPEWIVTLFPDYGQSTWLKAFTKWNEPYVGSAMEYEFLFDCLKAGKLVPASRLDTFSRKLYNKSLTIMEKYEELDTEYDRNTEVHGQGHEYGLPQIRAFYIECLRWSQMFALCTSANNIAVRFSPPVLNVPMPSRWLSYDELRRWSMPSELSLVWGDDMLRQALALQKEKWTRWNSDFALYLD
jgi:hypothetical protein